MTAPTPLACGTLADLHPAQVAYAPRTTLEATRWVITEAFRVDTITGSTLSLMGDMPLICHRAAATEPALAFIRAAGLQPPRVLLTYATEQQAIALARERVALGEQLAYIYPPPRELDAPRTLLPPLPLYGRLNDKRRLPELAGHRHLPQRFVIPAQELENLNCPAPDHPVYLKASLEGASGAGVDVRFAPDSRSWQAAIRWFREHSGDLQALVVEDAVDVETCWCMGVSILDSGCHYLGATIQTFDEPGMQSGNLLDPDNLPPRRAVELALEIAGRGREAGYRGIAGFDIGIDADGALFVFDLNFRLNSCTRQLLLHDSATQRVGARLSRSWDTKGEFSLASGLALLRPFVDSGVFLPTRLFDRDTWLESNPGATAFSLVDGIILAGSVEALDKLDTAMQQALAPAMRC